LTLFFDLSLKILKSQLCSQFVQTVQYDADFSDWRLRAVAVCFSVLRCVAICRSVLQCENYEADFSDWRLRAVAVRCGVLRCVAVREL